MTLASGARLGPYEIVELIGRGGMGEVYRAVDSRLARQVAIKILPSHLADHSESLARFRREARAIAALSHPNNVAVFDIGTQAETPYVVTELLSGETLRTALQRGGKLSIDETLRIAAALAEGLAAAHAKGIIHRDLKPENVFLTASGGVKILDFGLASTQAPLGGAVDTMTHGQALTEPGILIGTIGYMSPEQLRGGALTPATDVFSLGCVLFEMLAGDMPFDRDNTIEIITAVMRDDPFARNDTELPIEIRSLIERCLEKAPGDRFQDGSQLAAAVHEIAAAHATGNLSTASMARPRRPWRLRVAIIAASILVAIIAAVVIQRRQVIDNGYDLRAGDVTGTLETRRLTALALHADAIGNRTEAIELLRQATNADPHAPLPAAFLASFVNVLGNAADGDRLTKEARRRLPYASSSYETLLCRYLTPEGDTTTGMALSSSILELRPRAWRLRLSLAHLHLYRRELGAALTQLKEIDVRAPDDRRLATVLSDRASLGDVAAAERDLARSSLNAHPALLGYARGRMAWSRGRYAEAARDFDASAESATVRSLLPVANESAVLAGIARIATGDLDAAQSMLNLAAVKARQTGFVPDEGDAFTFAAYTAYRRGDAESMARNFRAAFAVTRHNTAAFDELRLSALRLRYPVPRVAASELDEDAGVASLVAAREAWARGDATSATRLLQQARAEGVDATWFAEQAALLAYDLGGPPRAFRPDPPYPNRLRFIAIWEMTRPRPSVTGP
jgi:tRNA A-37 threonylcarbamoyl transferase component Bud32/tetratricopeptide (TPR) repeat protein